MRTIAILLMSLSFPLSIQADGPQRSTKRVGIKDCGFIENVKIPGDDQIAVYGISNWVEGLVSTAGLYWDIQEGSNYPQGEEPRSLVLASKAITGEVLTSKRDFVQYGLASCEKGTYISSEFDWTYSSTIKRVEAEEKNQIIWTAGSSVSECHYSWEYLTNDGSGKIWHSEVTNDTGVLTTGFNVVAVRAESNCRGYRRLLVSESDFSSSESHKLTISNYPEPFNPSTNLVLNIRESSNVQIDLYNISGSKISSIENRDFHRGRHEIQIDASWLPTGSYLIVAIVDGMLVSKRLTLQK